MIRLATLADIPAIEQFMLAMKRRTELVTVKVEFERARKIMRQCVSSPQGFAAVAEHGGRITGVLLGIVDNYWFSMDRYASDIAFFSRRRGDGAALLARFKEWADNKSATLLMGQSSGQHMDATRRFYESQGLVCVGHVFMGERPISVRKMRSVK